MWWHKIKFEKARREQVQFNVPVNALQVISEMNLSSQSFALLLTTKQEQPPRDRMWGKMPKQTTQYKLALAKNKMNILNKSTLTAWTSDKATHPQTFCSHYLWNWHKTLTIEWLCERTKYVPQLWNWENHS